MKFLPDSVNFGNYLLEKIINTVKFPKKCVANFYNAIVLVFVLLVLLYHQVIRKK